MTNSMTKGKVRIKKKEVVDSAQRVPEPDPLPGISFDTRPDPIQGIEAISENQVTNLGHPLQTTKSTVRFVNAS